MSSSQIRKVALIYGTRPEAIKMAPVVHAVTASPHLEPLVVVTGQHRSMLDQVNALFGITPDHDLDILLPRQTLTDVTTRTLERLTAVLEKERPDVAVVQGDTTTCFAAALAAFYARIPVVHIEAGLRTDDPSSPFPEEINRRLTSQLAALHLAPTPTSRANLEREGIDPERIVVTGNTVIDALLQTVTRDVEFADGRIEVAAEGRVVLVTSHRRESWGEPMTRIAAAVRRLARRFPDVTFVLPAHRNPVVRDVLLPPLRDLGNVIVTEPLEYAEFARLMKVSELLLTDSGGVQEEGPSLGKPVLVMRETTERPEAVAAGTVRLVGADENRIVDAATTLLTDGHAYREMANAMNPYGDGRAARRTVQAIEHFLGFADRPEEFAPAAAEDLLRGFPQPRRGAALVGRG